MLGKKCKFSHDPAVERKQEKKNLYEDARGNEKKEDTMDNWDEQKLREVVMSKHGNPKTTTDKVCKHFIEAVENQKYGWFWTCMFPELEDASPAVGILTVCVQVQMEETSASISTRCLSDSS
jgi:hypothetical protein